METSSPKVWATYVIFKKFAQSNQSPKGRKIAQSGHPADNSIPDGS
jgi:hypothetical protein